MAHDSIFSFLDGNTGIYFVLAKEVDRVKIGRTVNIFERFSTMQTCSPVKLDLLVYFAAPVCIEKKIHARFASYHCHGEWFKYSGEIMSMVEKITRDYKDTVLV